MEKLIAIVAVCALLGGSNAQRIAWVQERPLTWVDFAGEPDAESRMKAHTHTTLSIDWRWENGVVQVTAVARFDPTISWAKPGTSAALLAHEQLHFDITEWHARQVRAYFGGASGRALHTDDEVRTEALAWMAAWQASEERYDDETRHSLDVVQQKAWQQSIRQELKSLEIYTQP
jgi:hypothetical protein